MKKFLFAVAISLALIACGDDSSSNANNGSGKSIGDDAFSWTVALYVNESEHMLIMGLEDYETMMCVVEEQGYTWKTVHITEEPDPMMYEFRNDTLILYDIYNGQPELDDGDILVGGTAGNLYGTWTYTGCDYNKNNNTTTCHEKTLRYTLRTITFSNGKAEIYYKVYYDHYLEHNSDFMNSYFMSSLIRTLNGNYPEAYLSDIWLMDSSSVQAATEKDRVVFTSKTKTSATFVLGDKTYSVNVMHVDMNLNREGFYVANENRDVQVEVSDGITTCTGEYFSHYMNADYCKVEYKDNLSTYEKKYPNGEQFIEAEKYNRSNEEEFKQCITGIAYKKYDPLDGYSAPEVAKKLKKYRKKQLRPYSLL
jgi:hypothetical protein